MEKKVSYLLKIALGALSLLVFDFTQATYGQDSNLKLITRQLEKALNRKDNSIFEELFENEKASDLKQQFNYFSIMFPNSKWKIKPAKNSSPEDRLIEISVNSKNRVGTGKYTLSASQLIAIRLNKRKIKDHNIISQYSILNTTKNKLNITINAPSKVEIGEVYNIDLILDKPLGENIVAGGLIKSSPNHYPNIINQSIPLLPLRTGGLFKSIEAPKESGSQVIAAIIAHPNGWISFKKTIQIVDKINSK